MKTKAPKVYTYSMIKGLKKIKRKSRRNICIQGDEEFCFHKVIHANRKGQHIYTYTNAATHFKGSFSQRSRWTFNN